jgi:hypothetical protein
MELEDGFRVCYEGLVSPSQPEEDAGLVRQIIAEETVMVDSSRSCESPVASCVPSRLSAALHEELDYLLNHADERVEDGIPCPDCARLAEVCSVLIRPLMNLSRKLISNVS